MDDKFVNQNVYSLSLLDSSYKFSLVNDVYVFHKYKDYAIDHVGKFKEANIR